MLINMRKLPGGTFVPANDMEAVNIDKFKTNEIYEAEIKLHRNPQFHSKMFVFFHFCFENWKASSGLEFMDEKGQFEVFRKNLTVLAGYYDQFYNLKGEVRIEAKSLSYSNMKEDEFRQCYIAITNAAMKHIFSDCNEVTENELLSFF